MFLQAIQFFLSMIAQLFTIIFSIQLSDNITFGGVIILMIISTILIRVISSISGLAEFKTESNPYKNHSLKNNTNVKNPSKPRHAKPPYKPRHAK